MSQVLNFIRIWNFIFWLKFDKKGLMDHSALRDLFNFRHFRVFIKIHPILNSFLTFERNELCLIDEVVYNFIPSTFTLGMPPPYIKSSRKSKLVLARNTEKN